MAIIFAASLAGVFYLFSFLLTLPDKKTPFIESEHHCGDGAVIRLLGRSASAI